MLAEVDLCEAIGMLGMLGQTLRNTYAHNYLDFQEGAKVNSGRKGERLFLEPFHGPAMRDAG